MARKYLKNDSQTSKWYGRFEVGDKRLQDYCVRVFTVNSTDLECKNRMVNAAMANGMGQSRSMYEAHTASDSVSHAVPVVVAFVGQHLSSVIGHMDSFMFSWLFFFSLFFSNYKL